LLGENKPIEFFGKVTTTDALFKEQMTQLCHTLGQFTSHSVEELSDQVEGSVGAPKKKGWGGVRNKMKLMTFNRTDIIGNGGSLPSWKEPSSAPAGPTVESAYLQIDGGSGGTHFHPPTVGRTDGQVVQNPLFDVDITTNAIAVGCTVLISGMQTPGFNGKYGTVIAVQGERWAVALHEEGGTSGEYGHLPAQANVVALKSNCITTV
jgi:hypothetical protein